MKQQVELSPLCPRPQSSELRTENWMPWTQRPHKRTYWLCGPRKLSF